MSPQPGTAGTADDPIEQLVTEELRVGNGPTVTSLVGTAFGSATRRGIDGTLVFTGGGSTIIDDGNAQVWVDGALKTIQAIEWVDTSGASHTVVEWDRPGLTSGISALGFDGGGSTIDGVQALGFDGGGSTIDGTETVGFT